jgi:hypothetical protein
VGINSELFISHARRLSLTDPIFNNNEFEAAESSLRKIGSNLWFSGLSKEWQDFLISNTLEYFDSYQLSMHDAASNMIRVYQGLVAKNPELLEKNPWQAILIE